MNKANEINLGLIALKDKLKDSYRKGHNYGKERDLNCGSEALKISYILYLSTIKIPYAQVSTKKIRAGYKQENAHRCFGLMTFNPIYNAEV
jgi:hypothetical protein